MFRKMLCLTLTFIAILTVFTPLVSHAKTTATVTTPTKNGAANIRTGPGTSHKVIAWGVNGDALEIISEGGTWHKVRLVKNGREGYIHSAYVSIDKSNDTTPTGFSGTAARVVTKSGNGHVNLRKSASTSGKVVTALVDGSKLVIRGESGNWYQVVDLYTGHSGYMHKNYVATTFSAVASGNVNMRKGGSTSYGIIKVIPKGTTVTVIEMGEGFSKIKSGADTGWISNKYLYTGC
ncbi:MAG: SH3 domain-containing protein [Christensenellales bacterium]|jgi:uncharacterized protein YgiM (DUF1202 family)